MLLKLTSSCLWEVTCGICENSPGVQLYRFPVDPETCREWIRRVKRTGFAVTANSRLCSNHFSGKKKLCPLHLPTIFSHQTYAKKYARAPPRKRVSVDDPTNTLFRVFGIRFEVRVRRRCWSENIVLKEPNFTRRNDGKDPLPSVSCSNAIMRLLFCRFVCSLCSPA